MCFNVVITSPTSFFETLFSSYVPARSWHCSFCSFDSLLLLAVLFCLLLDYALLSLCSVERDSRRTSARRRPASFVDFSSSLALLAVMLSLFSVFWRRFLQLYLVVVYCSKIRLLHLQRHYSARATS